MWAEDDAERKAVYISFRKKAEQQKNYLLIHSYKEIPDTYILILEKSFAVQRPYVQDLSDRWK